MIGRSARWVPVAVSVTAIAVGAGFWLAQTITSSPSTTTDTVTLAGNSTVQLSRDRAAGSDTEAFGYTASASGTATSISVYTTSTDGVRLALYADDASKPGALLDQASVASNTKGWVTLPLAGGVTIDAGTQYWLALGAVNGGSLTYYDAARGSNLDFEGSGFANPFSATGQWSSNPASIYLSGTSSGSTTTSPGNGNGGTTTTTSPGNGNGGTTTTTSPGSGSGTTTTTSPGSGSGTEKCTSNPQGALGPYDDANIVNSNGYNTYVGNNMWGANSGTTQTTCASDPGHWKVVASAGPSGYTGVQTYPDIQQLFNDWTGSGWNQGSNMTDTPLSALSSLSSTYATTNPPVGTGDWEAAYDIWLNNTPNNEIMVWVYTSTARGTGGADVIHQNVTIGGQSFTYQNYGGGLPQLVLNTNRASATIDLLGVLEYLQSIGQVSPAATIGQVDFGWEICSTAGQSLAFEVTSFSISGS